jgi:hypothetical protein
MTEALWERDGIRYLQPQIQLLYKAAGLRHKDWADFESTFAVPRQTPPWMAGRRAADHPPEPALANQAAMTCAEVSRSRRVRSSRTGCPLPLPYPRSPFLALHHFPASPELEYPFDGGQVP